MIMPARATRWSLPTPMNRIFKVSERVVVDVQGFEPWPATIQSVVSGEEGNTVSYHVTLDGSSKTIPMKEENIKLLGVVDAERYGTLSADELWHGARKRMEVIEGVYISMFANGYVESPLWQCGLVNAHYEKVPDGDTAKLKLSRVAHNAKVRYKELETKFILHAMQNRLLSKKKTESNRNSHIVQKLPVDQNSLDVIRFPCPMCSRRFKTRMALKKHLECNVDCSKKTVKTSELPKQCPKCFSLYKNEAMLLKHMAVHEKNAHKKKNGIRDYIRQVMSNNKARVPSFNPSHTLKSKAAVTNGKPQPKKTWLPDKKEEKMESSEDCEQEEEDKEEAEDNEEEEEDDSEGSCSSDTDSNRSIPVRPKKYARCKICRSANRCKCKYTSKSRHLEIHSEREKVRRRQMREAFENLASVLEVGGFNTCPKNTLLQLAREEVSRLEDKEKRFEQTLADLRDMNVRLDTRRYQLSCRESF